MSLPVLHPDDPDILYDDEKTRLVFYKNEKFTGILEDEWEYNTYKDGLLHGKQMTFYKNGQVNAVTYFDKGDFLSSSTYFDNGQLSSEQEEKNIMVWNLDQDVVRKNRIYYFKTGEIKMVEGNEKDLFASRYYTRKGGLICTQEKDVWEDGKYKRDITYNEDLMFEHYAELLVYENKELEHLHLYGSAESQRTHHIWKWFWQVAEKAPHKYIEIVNVLLKHPDETIRGIIASTIAINRFHPYIEPENKYNTEAYALIRQSTKYQDENFPDREVKKLNL